MRLGLRALAALLLWPLAAPAAETSFRAGFALTIAGDPPFPVGVWYPTLAKETDWTVGPYAMSAARDAAPAPGRFPLIVLSHGSGADQFHTATGRHISPVTASSSLRSSTRATVWTMLAAAAATCSSPDAPGR